MAILAGESNVLRSWHRSNERPPADIATRTGKVGSRHGKAIIDEHVAAATRKDGIEERAVDRAEDTSYS